MKDNDYVLFESHERVDLMFAALSRKDQDEVTKLRRTCPDRQYKGMDQDFKQPFEDIEAVISLFCITCLSYCNRILLARMDLTAIITMTTFSKDELAKLNIDDSIDVIKDMQAHIEIINFKQNNILRDLSYIKSAYRALELFFELTDINYEHITKWISIPSLDEIPIGMDRKYLSDVTYTPEFVDEIKTQFMSFWRGPKKSG